MPRINRTFSVIVIVDRPPEDVRNGTLCDLQPVRLKQKKSKLLLLVSSSSLGPTRSAPISRLWTNVDRCCP